MPLRDVVLLLSTADLLFNENPPEKLQNCNLVRSKDQNLKASNGIQNADSTLPVHV